MDSVVAAHQKLAAYYSKTYAPGGEVYNWAIILDPMQKLESYKSSSFSDDDRKAFESSICSEYTESYSNVQQTEPLSSDSDQFSHDVDFAELVISPQHNRRKARNLSPLDSYLTSDTTNDRDPLCFWQHHESDYPQLAQMA